MSNISLKPTTILQHNLNHARAANAATAQLALELKIDILLLQDPYVMEGRLLGFPGVWKCFHSTNNQAWLVITNPNIIYTAFPANPTSIFAQIETAKGPIVIGSQYIAPSLSTEDSLAEWESFIKNIPSEAALLVGGDFNARSPLWGYSYEDSRGYHIIEQCFNNDLAILNNINSGPTFDHAGRLGWPDLTLFRSNEKIEVRDWSVLPHPPLSDHKYILTTLSERPQHTRPRRYVTALGGHGTFRKHFGKHQSSLLAKMGKIRTTTDLDQFTEDLTAAITQCCNKAYRKKRQKLLTRFYWWTPELAMQRNKITALSRRLKKHSIPTEHTAESYKALIAKEKALFKKSIAKTRSLAWKKFCGSPSDKYGKIYKLAHGKTFSPSEILVHWQEHTNTMQAKVRLTEELFGPSGHATELPRSMPNMTGNKRITERELKDALFALNPNKAPGPDNLDVRIIRQSYLTNPALLLNWANKCLHLGHFPKPLKLGEVVFFHKTGKDPGSPKSYRPICLIPSLSKLLEKVVTRRLMFHLETNNLLSPVQHGFRENHSCESALDQLKTAIVANKAVKQLTSAIALDISGAFDSVSWQSTIRELIKYRCPSQITNMIASYLENRQVVVAWGNKTSAYTLSKGCPQGSCIGPALWLITAEKIIKNFASPYTKLIVFADDFLLVTHGRHRRELEKRGQEALDNITALFKENDLSASENKTSVITFATTNKPLKREPSLKINGSKIPNAKTLKYLGLILNRNFSWHDHIEAQKLKVQLHQQNLVKVAGRLWGVPSGLLKLWYKTVTESCILYAAGIWGTHMTEAEQAHLLKLQRPFLLRIARAYRTTPTAALHVLAGVPPLPQTVIKAAKSTALFRLDKEITIGAATFSPTAVEKQLNTLHLHPADRTFNIAVLHENVVAEMHIYTDGSKTEDGVGSAFVAFVNGKRIHEWSTSLNAEATVFQAELHAILTALEWLQTVKDVRTIALFSDSSSSLHAASNFMPKNSTVQSVQKQLHTLEKRGKTVILRWVKAHIGVTGNEAADLLAKEATKREPEVSLQLPKSYITKLLQESLIQNWQSEWDTGTTGRLLYGVLETVSTGRLFGNSSVNALLTNHGPFPEYLHRFQVRGFTTQLCVCGRSGNAEHYMFDCPITKAYHFRKPSQLAATKWAESINNTPALTARATSLIHMLISQQEAIKHP